MNSYNHSSSSQHGPHVPGFMYILGLVMSLTLEECRVVPTSRLL